MLFAKNSPKACIYATGGTAARTRLYKMVINKYFDIVQEDFEVFGLTENSSERFVKGKSYQAFVVQRKNLKFEP